MSRSNSSPGFIPLVPFEPRPAPGVTSLGASRGNSSSAVPVELFTPLPGRFILRILLIGIDGSGKTTAAGSLARLITSRGGSSAVLKNPAGRRNMAGWWAVLRWAPGPRLQDLLETVARTWSVLVTELRLRRFEGVAVLDRGLECQLALREARGLPRGVVLPWLQRVLPAPDVVVYFEVPILTALSRIDARGTDVESAADLVALDAGYRRLPEFPTFTLVDAGGSEQDVLGQLLPLIGAAARHEKLGSAVRTA